MEFSEEKAKDIISRFGLSETTLNVWKTRKSIPDRYFREGFEIKAKAEGERDAQVMRDVKRIFGYGKINARSVANLIGAGGYRIGDILKKGGVAPTKDEVLYLKKTINTLRIEAMKVLSLFNQFIESEEAWDKLKAFLLRDEIKHYVLIGKRPIASKISDWMNGKRSTPAPVEYRDEIVQALGVFITETNMF